MSLSVKIKKTMGEFLLDIDFTHEDGIAGFLGASGCGKSITLKCIAGILTPDEGCIVLNGRVLFDSEKKINLKPQERGVGYLFQNYALFPHMTVEQNILCGLCREKDKKRKKEKAAKLMDVMELSDCRNLFPHQLSGGQQQRCALARILAGEPELLLLDEPFSALDTYLREQLQTQVREILENYGKKTLLVSHNRDEIYYFCKKTAIMHQGRILNYGKTKEVFADPKSPAAELLTGCKKSPSMDLWLEEAKQHESAEKIGMYLTHNGVVRRSSRAKVRDEKEDAREVAGMLFSYDKEKVAKAIEETYGLAGIYYVRVWLGEGRLKVGDDIMYVLIGGDIRPHVVDALEFLVGKLKTECVEEKELYEADEN